MTFLGCQSVSAAVSCSPLVYAVANRSAIATKSGSAAEKQYLIDVKFVFLMISVQQYFETLT